MYIELRFMRITIYENEEEEYFSFITPEAYEAVQSYLEMRNRFGEQIGPDTILIREQFDIRDLLAITSPRPITARTVSNKITELCERAGIREKTVLKEGQKSGSVRKPVPSVHGLRKSFSTFALNANMDIIKRRMLEGHSVGIDEHYCLPSESDLEAEYMKAVDNLTINEENRLKRKVEKLEVEKNQFERLAAEIQEIKKAIKSN
jgi:integrase